MKFTCILYVLLAFTPLITSEKQLKEKPKRVDGIDYGTPLQVYANTCDQKN